MKKLFVLSFLALSTAVMACEGHHHADAKVASPVSMAGLPVYSDENKAIAVNMNEADFVVKLPSNPTTGYTWFVVSGYDSHAIELKGSQYKAEAHETGVVGSGGARSFHVHLSEKAFLSPTSYRLSFVYARPWEKSGEIKEFTIRTTDAN